MWNLTIFDLLLNLKNHFSNHLSHYEYCIFLKLDFYRFHFERYFDYLYA